jgi:hypothetical protein
MGIEKHSGKPTINGKENTMNNNNNNPQMPPSGQLPTHRTDEIAERLRQMETENANLRGQVNMMAQQFKPQPQQPQAPVESPFDEAVDRALNQKIQQVLTQTISPLQEQVTQQIGYLVDKNDELAFNQSYSGDRFSKYKDKVESVRREYETKGKYIPREEALRIVYFEETGKKAQPENPAPVTQEPKFDPYFGKMVNPETGKPLTEEEIANYNTPQAAPPTEQPVDQYAQPPAYNQPQAPQAPAFQPMPTGMQPPVNQNHPNNNPFQGMGELPPQGMNQPYGEQPTQQANALNLDVYASDDQLQAFDNKFGDVPL